MAGAFTLLSGDHVDAIRFYLVVEPIGDVWHWIVWRPGESVVQGGHGSARTAQRAMREAEEAAHIKSIPLATGSGVRLRGKLWGWIRGLQTGM